MMFRRRGMFHYKNVQKLNELELGVYNYVMTHRNEVMHMKIRQLAANAHVSTTTVLRFCTKMGCEGYSDFKLQLRIEKEKKALSNLSKRDDELQEFFKLVRKQAFQKNILACARMLKDAPRLFFFGMGSSGMMAQYGARLFSTVGIDTLNIEDAFYPLPEMDNESTVLIVLSVSGETEMVLQLVSRLKARSVQIISITNHEKSTLAKISDKSIPYYIPIESIDRHYNVTSQVPTVYLLEELARKTRQLKEQHSKKFDSLEK